MADAARTSTDRRLDWNFELVLVPQYISVSSLAAPRPLPESYAQRPKCLAAWSTWSSLKVAMK